MPGGGPKWAARAVGGCGAKLLLAPKAVAAVVGGAWAIDRGETVEDAVDIGAVPKMGTCGLADAINSAELARLATSEGGGVFVGGGVSTVADGVDEGAGTTKINERGKEASTKIHPRSRIMVYSYP